MDNKPQNHSIFNYKMWTFLKTWNFNLFSEKKIQIEKYNFTQNHIYQHCCFQYFMQSTCADWTVIAAALQQFKAWTSPLTVPIWNFFFFYIFYILLRPGFSLMLHFLQLNTRGLSRNYDCGFIFPHKTIKSHYCMHTRIKIKIIKSEECTVWEYLQYKKCCTVIKKSKKCTWDQFKNEQNLHS